VTNGVHYLETEPATQHSTILSEKLAALYQKEGKPELAIKYFRQALSLSPTPQTVVRLNLELGDQLAAAGHEAEALKLDDAFLQKTPAWPGALSLYQKMDALAVKLGDKPRAARYAAEIKRLTLPP
jgi:tetratricopeptide (TPR) repeat protein